VRSPRLILAAHGSTDPRYTAVFDSLLTAVTSLRPDLDVALGYLDHGPPELAAMDTAGAVIVPLLLTSGFHLRSDLPNQAPEATITAPLGGDHRITTALVDRLRQAGWTGQTPVVLAAAGSTDSLALSEVRAAADELGRVLGVAVEAAFVSAGEPPLSDPSPAAVATYLLAPGHFADTIRCCGAPIVAAPLGAHPFLAEIVLSRYDAGARG
jgi:sirohydrochlorin ferrochelatase